MIAGLPIGLFESICYLVYDEAAGEGIVVDPGGDTTPLLGELKRRNLKLKYILNTHGHIDHIAANAYLISATGAPLGLHPDDRDLLAQGGGAGWFDLACVPSPQPTLDLVDGLILEVGTLHLQVLHTPGHTPGSICLYIPEDNTLLTGDTLFKGSVGRTDLPGGNARALTASLRRLITLPPQTTLYPGHGPASTLEIELRTNPWLRRLPSQ